MHARKALADHGYKPRNWRASKIRVQAVMKAAVRKDTPCSLAVADTEL